MPGDHATSARGRKRSLSSEESCSSSAEDHDASGNTCHYAGGSSTKLTKIVWDHEDNPDPLKRSRTIFSCTLPPHCSSNPSTFETSAALASHYQKHHANVCSSCDKIFPDDHFLSLHISEFHDPLVEIRRERGERTYRCFSNLCDRSFRTPKGRRRHLVATHGYPKEYFFALPKYGLERLYRQFGESASLVTLPRVLTTPLKGTLTEESLAREHAGTERPCDVPPDTVQITNPESSSKTGGVADNAHAETLAKLEKMSLVPHSVRFGRKGINCV